MSVSYVSSVTDLPGVQTAISHLQDLQSNMRAAHGFQTQDVSHIDVIITCIQDLERERMTAHEQLETETIKASVLRHKLMYYPDEIKKEIEDAVGAARKDNEEELAYLNKELNKINEDIAYSSEKLKEIEEENGKLAPERDRVKAENEEIIAHLNERMSVKATKQITLNDTRDKLRDTNQKIVELEEGMVILKEDLIQERNDHRIEKNRLKDMTSEATDKTMNQKHTNAVKRLELTNLREQLSTLTSDFTTLKNETVGVEDNIVKLCKEEQDLGAMLESQILANEKLKRKGIELDAHGVQMDKDFEQRKSQALAKIEKLNRDIDREKERGEVLEGQRRETEERYQEANDIRKSYESKVNELKDQLQRAQDMYKNRVEDVGRLTQENQDMELRLVELAEEHELLVRNLNAEINDERDKLAIKRKERMELQAEREESQRVLTDFRGEQQKYLREMNKQITELRNKHDTLTEEGRELRKIIKQDEKDIVSTTSDLEKAKEGLHNMKTSMGMMIDKLEASVSKLKAEKEEKTRILAEKTPIFEALEKDHNEAADNFDKVKKNIVSLKNKKNGLDDSCQRMQRDIEKLEIPQKASDEELRKQRALTMEQFKVHAESRQETERELYSVGVKLKTVLEENDRFRNAINALEKRKEELLRELEATALKKDRLLRGLETEKNDLLRAWLLDQNLTEENAERDRAIVEAFTDLLSRTDERQQIISGVSKELNEELGRLETFLKTVSTKRPKAVRKEIKKASRQASRETDARPGSELTRPASQGSLRSTLMPGKGTPLTLTPRGSRVPSRVPSRAPSTVVGTLEPPSSDY